MLLALSGIFWENVGNFIFVAWWQSWIDYRQVFPEWIVTVAVFFVCFRTILVDLTTEILQQHADVKVWIELRCFVDTVTVKGTPHCTLICHGCTSSASCSTVILHVAHHMMSPCNPFPVIVDAHYGCLGDGVSACCTMVLILMATYAALYIVTQNCILIILWFDNFRQLDIEMNLGKENRKKGCSEM